jgi:hypothetical protein
MGKERSREKGKPINKPINKTVSVSVIRDRANPSRMTKTPYAVDSGKPG